MSCGALSCSEADIGSSPSSSSDSIAWLLLSSCVRSSSDLGSDFDDIDFGLLGRDGSCEDGRSGVRLPGVRCFCAVCCLVAWCRNPSMLFGLIVDRLLLPFRGGCAWVGTLDGDVLRGLPTSIVSFNVLCGESFDIDADEPRRSRSDSFARKNVVGPDEGAICSVDCLRGRTLPSNAVLGRMMRHRSQVSDGGENER